MSHTITKTKNKQHGHPKTYFKHYLNNAAEPPDDRSNDSPPELEAELLENSFLMRRHLRHAAQRLRNHYS